MCDVRGGVSHVAGRTSHAPLVPLVPLLMLLPIAAAFAPCALGAQGSSASSSSAASTEDAAKALKALQAQLDQARKDRLALEARLEKETAADIAAKAKGLSMAPESDALQKLEVLLDSAQARLLLQRDRIKLLRDEPAPPAPSAPPAPAPARRPRGAGEERDLPAKPGGGAL